MTPAAADGAGDATGNAVGEEEEEEAQLEITVAHAACTARTSSGVRPPLYGAAAIEPIRRPPYKSDC